MKACIFDLDGTLLDSTGVWEQVDIDFLAGRGIEVPSDYMDIVAPMTFPEAAAYTIARFGLREGVEDLLREWNRMAVYAYGHRVRLKPYVRTYLGALRERGVKLGVATSLPAELYGPALENCGLWGYFEAVCSTDEVDRGKAHPDVYLLCARRLGVEPAACVVFEDILEAVVGAKAAGMVVYGVYDEASRAHWARVAETADGALLDLRDAPLPKEREEN